jgi:hypothetical protein
VRRVRRLLDARIACHSAAMPDPITHPHLAAVRKALAVGDMNALRAALADLDDEERRLLEVRLGPGGVDRLQASAQRRRRARSRGRVVVIHGIMGAQLDVVDASGVAELVWVSYWPLLRGRISDLAVDGAGHSVNRIALPGLFPDYLPMVTHLAEEWDVLPFAYDWRLDIDASARALAARVREWTHGEPVHIVAHSMGGLVSRRMSQLVPEAWRSMADGTANARGGRLVMLGTPNKGSFAICLALTGEEKLVRMLAMLDIRHSLAELLEILAAFPGSYQMLPSGALDVDDRRKLYDRRTWGASPVRQALIDAGRAFQEAVAPVVDPERLIYVAGYDQDTPYRIKVVEPGDFEYQETRDGDGRVPHELGLLDGVPTFWVDEVHGDLPKNERVLAGITELLATGTTSELASMRPRARRAPSEAWRKPEEIEQPPDEFLREVAALTRRGTEPAPELDRRAAAVEAMIVRDYVGAPRGPVAPPVPARKRPAAAAIRLRVEVVWGDITRVRGDVYAVGHYRGVAPQNVEAALDVVVSERRAGEDDRVLAGLTRRGVLRGDLGEIDMFPWADRSGRLVAVAGMGFPGTFGRIELRRLTRNLTWAVTALPQIETVCTVLIGSGAGNLSIPVALDGMVSGLRDALARPNRATPITRVRIVERDYRRATEIHAELVKLGGVASDDVAIDVARRLRRAKGASLGAHGLALVIEAAARAAEEPGSRGDRALARLLGRNSGDRKLIRAELAAASRRARHDAVDVASSLDVSPSRTPVATDNPTRLGFVAGAHGFRASVLTQTVVVPERVIGIDETLLDEAVATMADPSPADVGPLSARLTRLVVPRDFREYLGHESALVVEVDRSTARIHWEMLCDLSAGEVSSEPLALVTPLARQLRTTYSPPPSPAPSRVGRLRALVVGDPGDPRLGHSLPGARREALEVVRVLRAKNVDVVALIGAPSDDSDERLDGIDRASRIAVLGALMEGGFDLLHYAGHGAFDYDDPDRAGWLFEGGSHGTFLTSGEIERVDVAPRLIVANACFSGLTSERLARGAPSARAGTEADLLPGLADEFFRRGVRNYIGTAWAVDDAGAIAFAETLYDRLLAADGSGSTIGDAMLAARQTLKKRDGEFRALWAAYRHYGDPTERLQHADASSDDGGSRRSRSARRRRRG